VVVFPSRDGETFGNVILEAWSYGKPLVATAFRGAREIARHGEDSWVVPCDDPDALARGIQQVLSDPGLQQDMVSAGSRRLQQEFSEAVIIDQYRDLYDSLTA
jgi:glycosyltransferase involved in cell wall biosynthesis